MSGQNLCNTRHQRGETVIRAETVGNLRVKWALSVFGPITATPAVEDGAVYIVDTPTHSTAGGSLYKVDGKSGIILWQREISLYSDIPTDYARTTPAVTAESLILGNQPPCLGVVPLTEPCPNASLFAVEKKYGKLLWRTVVDTIRSAVITQSPVVYNGRVYAGVASNQESLSSMAGFECCDFRGKAVAVNAKDGTLEHETYMTPPTSTGYSGVSVWGSTAVVDEKRNRLYVTTGDNYSVPDSVEACIRKVRAEKKHPSKDDLLACNHKSNRFDSIVALDLETFEPVWTFHGYGYDAFNNACLQGDPANCPDPPGPDYDFGQGAALFTLEDGKELLGAGEKSGVYYALDPETGDKVWKTKVGPGGTTGGSEWGAATDGDQVYVAISNSLVKKWELVKDGKKTGKFIHRGLWSALDAKDGRVLWKFSSGGVINSGAAVVDGVVYWGNINSDGNSTLYAFCVAGQPGCP